MGDGKKSGKVKVGESKEEIDIPTNLYIPRNDSWRSSGGGLLPVDVSQQPHLKLPVVSPLTVPSSGLTPRNGFAQPPSLAALMQPSPLPSPQPSPRRSRHPMKQQENKKVKRSSKVPTKKKTSSASTRPSLHKKSHSEGSLSSTGVDFDI
eukprot:7930187-Ditylum_brightwellii.AAC.1